MTQDYNQLLEFYSPRIIRNDAEYERLLSHTQHLFFKDNLSDEESDLLDLLVLLTREYEHQKLENTQLKAHQVLQHLMEAKGIRQVNLVGVIGSSGVVSEVLQGKRRISKAQAKSLGLYFSVNPCLFIDFEE